MEAYIDIYTALDLYIELNLVRKGSTQRATGKLYERALRNDTSQ